MEYSEILRTSMDIEEEKRENTLVLDTIKNLENDRKCWRLVGGVLVERTLGEVVQSLKENVEVFDKTGITYQTALQNKEKALLEFENQYNLRPNRDNFGKKDDGTKKTSVLA
ncbi:prefoldin subunit 2, putative [Ichthyophthirius multifiliis]|uniref:Prefoldin subunit 2, putative n=1 Tax=Ichthyophthirius multifiliis TaxID=5932 RepID=G0QJR9_ICHMU|nr:prefoldin subunit 2, putative [Ichthyophthirius multifiliis]EGR34538.1 prefoldin subunit 2, putative [Ichthyophthirius multifiliis]|eukprot:XP_004039842.1 prefoldin subunit 2, putative [Ichthyophthirius multifiliis]